MDLYIYEGVHISELRSTKDDALISKVIADDDEGNKMTLIHHNANLSDVHFMALAGDESARVRQELAWRNSLPSEVLAKLRSDEVETVRVQALRNSKSEDKFFVEAVLHGKLSGVAKQAFRSSVKAVGNFEVFKLLWNMGERSRVDLLWALREAARPPVPTNPSVLLDTVQGPAPIHPKVLDMVHEVIRGGKASDKVRESYAGAAQFALPEILDSLKDDLHYPVIKGVAANSSAWASTHRYIYAHHRSKKVLSSLAWASKDNELLNDIYQRTNSKEIRWMVENNSNFILLVE